MSNRHSVFGHLQDSDASIRRRRLLFRCWHRGTQESDLILGRFAEAYIAKFADAQLEQFEGLLGCADADLFDWVVGNSIPPEEYDHDVMDMLRAFARRCDGKPRRLVTIEE